MQAILEQLYIRAATFEELLSNDFVTVPGQKIDADRAAQRLATWCKCSTNGDWHSFARRLASDGWTIEFVLQRFSTVRVASTAAAPQWLQDSIWVLDALVQPCAASSDNRPAERADPLPFEDMLEGLLAAARKRRDDRLEKNALDCLDSAANNDLDRMLLAQVIDLSMILLYEEFDRFRDERQSMDKAGASADDPKASNNLYLAFVAEARGSIIRSLFDKYPVLLRLLASVTRQWIETTSEFIVRLSQDIKAVRVGLFGTSDSALVVGVEGGLSDLHNSGRSVLIVRFSVSAVLTPPSVCREDRRM